MPIRPDQRWLYPIDWKQLSDAIRFGRANARCERCKRPHRRHVVHLGDGRWWDADGRCWRSDRGCAIRTRTRFALAGVRSTFVVLACAHLDHDPGNNAPANLAALCQRCHMRHDAAEHRWRRWWNAFRLRAIRDLYEDPRLARGRATQHRRRGLHDLRPDLAARLIVYRHQEAPPLPLRLPAPAARAPDRLTARRRGSTRRSR